MMILAVDEDTQQLNRCLRWLAPLVSTAKCRWHKSLNCCIHSLGFDGNYLRHTACSLLASLQRIVSERFGCFYARP